MYDGTLKVLYDVFLSDAHFDLYDEGKVIKSSLFLYNSRYYFILGWSTKLPQFLYDVIAELLRNKS